MNDILPHNELYLPKRLSRLHFLDFAKKCHSRSNLSCSQPKSHSRLNLLDWAIIPFEAGLLGGLLFQWDVSCPYGNTFCVGVWMRWKILFFGLVCFLSCFAEDTNYSFIQYNSVTLKACSFLHDMRGRFNFKPNLIVMIHNFQDNIFELVYQWITSMYKYVQVFSYV